MSAGMFGGKRVLRINPAFLEYGQEGPEAGLYARVRKEDIADIRHSMSWVIWYRFYVGCTFKIEVKTKDGNLVRIRFAAYFAKKGAYQDMYDDIMDLIWDYYLNDIVAERLQRFAAVPDMEVGGLRLTEKGVYLPEREELVAWPDVAVKEYETYFAVYNQRNPEINKRIEIDEWESELLLEMLEALQQQYS